MTILKFLEENKVFAASLTENKTRVKFWECCDYYFDVNLTEQELLRLADELVSLAQQIREANP